MPCVVTREEEEWYEQEANKKEYGVADLDSRITTTVACELAKILEKHGLMDECSAMTKKWVKKHKKEDQERSKRKS